MNHGVGTSMKSGFSISSVKVPICVADYLSSSTVINRTVEIGKHSNGFDKFSFFFTKKKRQIFIFNIICVIRMELHYVRTNNLSCKSLTQGKSQKVFIFRFGSSKKEQIFFKFYKIILHHTNVQIFYVRIVRMIKYVIF